MAPRTGIVRRVVLFTNGFNDRTVDTLEDVPTISDLVKGLREIRLFQTKISPAGIARLKTIFPNVKINHVSAQEWDNNVNTASPRYNLETNEFDFPLDEPNKAEHEQLQAELLKRFGVIPDGF